LVRLCQDKLGYVRVGYVRSGNFRLGQDRTCKNILGQVRTC